MAVGTYKLPICDGCKLPWLPVGWSQDSDPRVLPKGAKPLRCGKCKSSGWDREHNKAVRNSVEMVDMASDGKITTIHMDVSTGIPTMIETVEEMSIEEAKRRYPLTSRLSVEDVPLGTMEEPEPAAWLDSPLAPTEEDLTKYRKATAEPRRTRCKHRMTDCPICNPKETA